MSILLPPIFAGLNPDDQTQARNLLAPFSMGPDEIIMEEGEADASIAFIVRGAVTLTSQGAIVGTAGAREMIGEMELFTGRERLATARTNNPTELLILGADQYVELAEAGNPIVNRIELSALRRIGDRIRSMDERITAISTGEPFELHPTKPGLLEKLNPFKRSAGPSINAAAVLADSELFSWADPLLLNELASQFEGVRFGNDQRLCTQGEPGDSLYVLESGQVDIVLQVSEDRAERIATLGPGMALGDSSILHGCPRTATVVAKGDVTAIAIDRDHFMALVESDAPAASVFRQGLIRNLVMQVEKTQARLVYLRKALDQREEEMYKGTPVSSVWRG